MKTIKEIAKKQGKVYIILSTATRHRFACDVEREGITYGDGTSPTEREMEDIMVLYDNGTIAFLGWAGRVRYHNIKESATTIDYEKYIDQN